MKRLETANKRCAQPIRRLQVMPLKFDSAHKFSFPHAAIKNRSYFLDSGSR